MIKKIFIYISITIQIIINILIISYLVPWLGSAYDCRQIMLELKSTGNCQAIVYSTINSVHKHGSIWYFLDQRYDEGKLISFRLFSREKW